MRLFIITIITALLCVGCVKEDNFGRSDKARIKTFVLEGQSGNATISDDSLSITIPVPDTTLNFTFTPSEITVSNFATVSPSAGLPQNFVNPVAYTVTAEDGNIRVYQVGVERGGSQVQLDNSSFEDWFSTTVLGTSIEQPGTDENSTIWGTANRGLALGGSDANTTRQMEGDSSYVRMESVEAPALVRIAAATVFTGKFEDGFPSVSDPRSNIDLGTPFTARPSTFSFSFRYEPGASNEDADGLPLSYGDQCDIYLFLENREGSEVKRIATAWFRNGETVTDWSREEVEIKYGPLDASDPWFEYAQPLEGESWGDGTEAVTHISVLATSSFEGDFFRGAIGSTLDLDNIALGY